MLQYCFQIFLIFILCAFIQVNHATAKEHAAGEAASFSDIESRGKCTAEKCKCTDIPQWNGTSCIDVWERYPGIHIQEFKYLPERMFLGLHISSVKLMDPDLDIVPDNFLEGILGLEKFWVARSSIKAVPDFRFVKHSIKKVLIHSSRLTSLEGKNLQNLTSVSFLTFSNNSIRHIDPDVFLGTDNVQVLSFDRNKLTYIPPKLLNPMRRLRTFYADLNNLLHVDNLFSVARPTRIYLRFNNITKFNLSQNPKNSGWEVEITEMDLSYNFIKDISLSFSTCDMNHDSILKIRILILNENKILNLNNTLRCLGLKRLEINLNQIQYLAHKDFISVYNTEELLLRENQIGRIDTDTFKPFNTSLRELDLSFNRITCINGSIKCLYNLEKLNLSYNSIQTFADDEFFGLDSLQYLYLEYNQVKSLGKLQNLENLRDLDITHNNIIFIKPDELPKTLKNLYLADNPMACNCNLKPFLIFLEERQEKGYFEADIEICLRSDNGSSLQKQTNCPRMCSCSCTEHGDDLFMFVDCSSRNLYSISQFSNNNLPWLEDNETISSVHRGHLPIEESVRSSFHVEDRSIGLNLENNNLEFIGEAQLPPNLSRLYLSNNRLRLLPDSLFDNQRNLKQISLSGNPWICNCKALKFKKWLISNRNITIILTEYLLIFEEKLDYRNMSVDFDYGKILDKHDYRETTQHAQKTLDFDNIRCGITDKGEENLYRSVIWKLHDSDLCHATNLILIFSVSLCVLIFAICLSAKNLYAKYKLNVKALLYSRGITFVKEGDDIHHDKVFDAFMSFSHEDDEFVIMEIISEIEKRNPNIRLCLHYRHFVAGLQILSNIIHAIENSKVTVLILTKHFLNSEWCLTEFRTAYDQTLEDKLHKIIVVKVGELPKDMDPGIKAYLKRKTYLTWGETDFWKKLLFVLPSRPAVKNQVLRNTGENEVVTNCSVSEL